MKTCWEAELRERSALFERRLLVVSLAGKRGDAGARAGLCDVSRTIKLDRTCDGASLRRLEFSRLRISIDQNEHGTAMDEVSYLPAPSRFL